jgi:TrmH family RNA methyltransferase
MKEIASRANPLFKRLRKLADSSRERKKSAELLLEGSRLIGAYRDAVGEPELLVVQASAGKREAIRRFLRNAPQAEIVQLDDSLFAQISEVESPAGLLAIAKIPRERNVQSESCALLDDTQDPGNLGSILRSCAAAGVLRVCLSPRSADAWSPKVLRAAAGAHFSLSIGESVDLAEVARKFTGQVVATLPAAEKSVFELDLRGAVAFVFGNEGAGVSPKLQDAATVRVKIPIVNKMDSLNAAAAAAVCLFEKVRQEQTAPLP